MHILMFSEAKTAHAQRWASAMADCGCRVTLLSRSDGVIPGVDVLTFTVPGRGRGHWGSWWTRYNRKLHEVISRVDPDLLHVHYLQDYPLTESHVNGRPLVVSTWGSDVVRDAYCSEEPDDVRRRKVSGLKLARKVTATNPYLALHTAHYGNLRLEDIEIIPFGVNLSQFARPNMHDASSGDRMGSDLVIGVIKHLEPRYGIDTLIQSIPEILRLHPQAEVRIIGSGSAETSLRKLARELHVSEHIAWKGQVPYHDIPTQLAEMDIFVMPSRSEVFGVAAAEAMAMRVPVVASDIPGVNQLVMNERTGLLVAPGDAHALAEAVHRLALDDVLRTVLVTQAHEHVARCYNFNDNVRAMLQLYSRILDMNKIESDPCEAGACV